LNRLANEAVGEYLDAHAATIEAELEATLRRVKAYRQADPDFESAISKFAEAEAESAADDPVEGQTTRVRIHPFANGNGRTARIWANAVLMRYGLPPVVRLRPRPDGGYRDAGVAAMSGDWRPTAAVFRRMLAESLAE
jgi:hypothetical protein